MAQIVSFCIEVPSRYSSMGIGYTVKTMDRKIYSSFKIAVKSSIANTFEANVVAPSNGGYMVWGLENQDLWLDTIEPQITIPDFKSTLSSLIDVINSLVFPKPEIVLQTDTSEFIREFAILAQAITEQLDTDLQKNSELIKPLVTQMDELTAKYNNLKLLDSAVEQHSKLEDLRKSLNEFMLGRSVTLETNGYTETNLDTLLTKIHELNEEKIKSRKNYELDVVNKFLGKLENISN